MKQLAILMGCVLAAILFVYMLTRIDSGGVAMLVGLVFGMLAAVPSVLLVLASSHKPAYAEEDDDDKLYYRSRQGERELPAYPYQPPVIVLAAPVADEPPVVNGGSVTASGSAASVPTVYDRQRQVAAEQGRKEVQRLGHNGQGARVFRVVEREEWDE